MDVLKQIDLTKKNTMGLPCLAEQFVQIHAEADLPSLSELLRDADQILVFGGGSNLILPPVLKCPVIRVCADKILYSERGDQQVLVEADAGVIWDELVRDTTERGLNGIENLSLIPGTVGAAPVQNIGAYGVELESVLEYVRVYDFQTEKVTDFSAQDCQFAYRDSLFKRNPGRYLILKVGLILTKKNVFNLAYGDLKTLLGHANLNSKVIRNEVVRIRQLKLPDPSVLANSGSFFKNPVVSEEKHAELLLRYPDLVSYPVGEHEYKLAAGWLIDKAGWKGRRSGNVGVHEKQALVLVNYGKANREDLISFASAINADIVEKYGLDLEIEPVQIPVY